MSAGSRQEVDAVHIELPDRERGPTLDNLINELRTAKSDWEPSHDKASRGYSKYLFLGGLGGILLAWIGTVAVGWGAPAWTVYPALVALLFGTIAVVAASISNAIGFAREWRTLESDMLDGTGKKMGAWYEEISRIGGTYTPDQIHFAQDYIAQACSQIRARSSYIIGALDKVGLVPLLASVALALSKFFQEGQLPFLWCTAAAVAGLFYVIALRFIDMAFTLERFSVLLKHAATQSLKDR